MTIALKIDDNVELGNKEIGIKKQVLVERGPNREVIEHSAEFKTVTVSSKLTIVDEADLYDKGYGVKIKPFAFNDDLEDMEFTINAAAPLAKAEFDITLPEVVGSNQLYELSKGLGITTATTTLADNGTGKIHVSIERKNTKTIKDGNTVAKLSLGYDADVLHDGMQTISVTNVKLTDADGNSYSAAPYFADVFIGSAKAQPVNGTVAFNGDYSDEETAALLTAALPADNNLVSTVDLTKVTALPVGKTIAVSNPNALILTSSDLALANDKNVVIGKECENLVLVDGYSFVPIKTFHAARASYDRSTVNTYGTLCLPFPTTSNSTVQLYSPKSIENNTLILEPCNTVDAGTPVIIKNITPEISLTAENVSIAKEITPASNCITLYGSYTQDMKVNDENAYYIKKDKFYQRALATETVLAPFFYCDAFRAYFTIPETVTASARIVNIVTTDNPTAVENVKSSVAGGIKEIYGSTGIRRETLGSGINIVRFGDGTVRSVYVK